MPQGTTTGSGYRETLDGMLDEHRAALHDCLGGLGEEEVRRSLVPSRTTLLGLVKHVTFVERVWFDQAVTGRSRRQIGIPATPDASFVLRADDTVASVQAAVPRGVRGIPPDGRGPGAGRGRHRAGRAPGLADLPAHGARAGAALRARRHPARADPRGPRL